jgi:hypothetical protein
MTSKAWTKSVSAGTTASFWTQRVRWLACIAAVVVLGVSAGKTEGEPQTLGPKAGSVVTPPPTVPVDYYQRGVYARSKAGDLVVYKRQSRTVGQPWEHETVSRPGCQFVGNPVPVQRISDAPSQPTGLGDVFARTADGHLVHYAYYPLPSTGIGINGWRCTDVTAVAISEPAPGGEPVVKTIGGPAIASQPAVAITRTAGSMRIDVFARGADNKLAHYAWVEGSGWSAHTLTDYTIQGNVDVVASGGPRLDVFARSDRLHLVHYWWLASEDIWHPSNMTTDTPGAAPIVLDPVAVGSLQGNPARLRLDVFSLGVGGDLVHYWWSAQPPAIGDAENLTSLTLGPMIYGPPAVKVSYSCRRSLACPNPYLRLDVVGWQYISARNWGLAHYWWSDDPGATWDAEGLWPNVGPQVHTFPVIAMTVEQPSVNVQQPFFHAFGGTSGGQLSGYKGNSRTTGWNGEDLTSLTGGPQAVWSSVDAWGPDIDDGDSNQDVVEVYGRSESGDLIFYWGDHSSWGARNVTGDFAGPKIAGDPVVMGGQRVTGQ